MRIAIYGAGSMGTIIGAYLTKAGKQVDLINRNKAHIDALKTSGTKITGTVNMQVKVNALLPEEMTGQYDLIFLLTKQLDNKNVVSSLANYLTEEGIICTAQNGLPELLIAKIIGEERTFGCAISWGAVMHENGVCELTSQPDRLTFSIGSLTKHRSEKLDQIKELLEVVGHVTIEDNFMGARWSKILINSAFSGMSAVLGCTFGEAVKQKESRKCIQRLMNETLDVANKAGIILEPVQGKNISKLIEYHNRFEEFIVFSLIPLMIRKHAKLTASMLQDLEKGKLTEVDAINGIVCQFGKEYQLSTPYNDLIVKIIHGIESGTYIPSMENIHLFKQLE